MVLKFGVASFGISVIETHNCSYFGYIMIFPQHITTIQRGDSNNKQTARWPGEKLSFCKLKKYYSPKDFMKLTIAFNKTLSYGLHLYLSRRDVTLKSNFWGSQKEG